MQCCNTSTAHCGTAGLKAYVNNKNIAILVLTSVEVLSFDEFRGGCKRNRRGVTIIASSERIGALYVYYLFKSLLRKLLT